MSSDRREPVIIRRACYRTFFDRATARTVTDLKGGVPSY